MSLPARSWLLPAFEGLYGRLVVAEALLLVGTGTSLGASWVMGRAVDAGAGDPAAMVRAAGVYLGSVAVSATATWLSRVSIERVAQAAMLRVKERLFGHVMGYDVALHDELGTGRLLSRVNGDVEALRSLLSEAVLQVPADLALAVGLLAVLTWQAPALAIVAGATVPIYAGLIVLFRRAAPARMLAARESAARLSGFYAEHLRALPVLRAYRRTDWVRARGDELGAEKARVDIDAGMAGVHFFNGLFGVRAVSLAVMVWVGALEVQRGALTVGMLLVGLDYARKLIEPFLRLQFQLTTIERARAGAVRIGELLGRAPTVLAPPEPAPWPGFTEMTVEDASFAYRPGEPVLNGVSLDIPRGKRVALVGPTGGGKSTIVQLLLRFRDPTGPEAGAPGGVVRVSGVDVKTLDPAVLRRHIGLVSQGVHLLPGTVAENLGVDEARAAVLLERVGLAGRLTPGLRIGEGGEGLSRGEAQLLCFARAMADEPELLVLDEATAAMDPATEARVVALSTGRTVVCVAHRLRTVVDYDVLHVVSAGRIVESGTHGELLARGGVYAGLWRAQLAGEGA